MTEAVEDLNPGIAETVTWLNSLGYETTDSGDGGTHSYGCDRDGPYVVIRVAAIDLVPRTNSVYNAILTHLCAEDAPHWLNIEGVYQPSLGNMALIDINGISDARMGFARSHLPLSDDTLAEIERLCALRKRWHRAEHIAVAAANLCDLSPLVMLSQLLWNRARRRMHECIAAEIPLLRRGIIEGRDWVE